MRQVKQFIVLSPNFFVINFFKSVFYNDLVKYMTSGPIVAAILEKGNAVEDFRKLIGSTDPSKAAPGTIRALFAKSIDANAIHGSDSDENAKIEGDFFFSVMERV